MTPEVSGAAERPAPSKLFTAESTAFIRSATISAARKRSNSARSEPRAVLRRTPGTIHRLPRSKSPAAARTAFAHVVGSRLLSPKPTSKNARTSTSVSVHAKSCLPLNRVACKRAASWHE